MLQMVTSGVNGIPACTPTRFFAHRMRSSIIVIQNQIDTSKLMLFPGNCRSLYGIKPVSSFSRSIHDGSFTVFHETDLVTASETVDRYPQFEALINLTACEHQPRNILHRRVC